MKRILLIATLAAAAAAPAIASAQNYQQDQQHYRQERHEYQQSLSDLERAKARAAQDGRITADERRQIGQAQAAVGQERREFHQAQRWSRNDKRWMQQRREFQAYAGRRPGFWFAPGYGYVQVDPRFRGYGWRVGGVVPWQLRNYAVADPWFYGVQPAPPGFRWVWLDNNIALVNLRSGAIVQIVWNVY